MVILIFCVGNMGNSKVKLSVVMATYNGEKYIANQLDSIIAQTLSVDEIIIVDDCSTDNTIEILERYAQKYNYIKIYCNAVNSGVVRTFNKALDICVGDYILFSDQDDVWLYNKTEVLLEEIKDNWLIYSDSYVTDEELNITDSSSLSLFESGRSYHDVWSYLLGNNVTGCTMLINRHLLELGMPLPNLSIMYHDHYFALLAISEEKLHRCNKVLQYYRQHSTNQSEAFKNISYKKIIENSNKMSSDMLLLLKNKVLSKNTADILLAYDFYKAMAHDKYPSYLLFKKIFPTMSIRMFFWFIRMACLGKYFANLNYNLAPLKVKIKKMVSK
mgnify:CR=1 FL=1